MKKDIEIIKPNKDNNNKSLLAPIIYLIIGIILAFRSNEAVKLLFYVIGIFIIIYGIKSFMIYYKNKNNNINFSIAIVSIIIGILLIILSEVLEISIRYILGFFLIYMGVSRLLTDFSMSDYKNIKSLSNIVLIVLGVFSIFISNAILVIVGWILIINSLLLFWEYLRN